MTDENRRENIRLELERARGALNAARILFEQREYADSVSRAYYGMLHSCRAVLLIEGVEARSHTGVCHLLNLRFVRTGRFPARSARLLARMQAERETADYDRAAVFTTETAQEVMDTAREFCTACRDVIEIEGYAADN